MRADERKELASTATTVASGIVVAAATRQDPNLGAALGVMLSFGLCVVSMLWPYW